jgi:hypothetical protein
LSCFQNRFLQLKFRKKMVVLHGFHLKFDDYAMIHLMRLCLGSLFNSAAE